MRLFIETLMVILKKHNFSQTELVTRCNKKGAKAGLKISKGAISNYKRGRFPEPSYASLIIRSVSDDPADRRELTVAYLRDVAHVMGANQKEIDIVDVTKKPIDQLQMLPAHLKAALTSLGVACTKLREYRSLVKALSDIANREMRAELKKMPTRGMKKRFR